MPAHLAEFRPTDWPGRTWEDRFGFWRDARRAWFDEHGWPGGVVELIRGQRDVRRRHQGLPPDLGSLRRR